MGVNIRNPIVNQLGFLACWWLCAAFANWGAAVAAGLVLLHLALHPRRASELSIIVLCGGIGVLVDAVLLNQGWLAFGPSTTLPPWLPVLWAAFAATLNQSLCFLQQRLWLAALLGAIFGPVSYWSGMQLGRLCFPASTVSTVLVLGLIWSLLLPAQLLLSKTLSAGREVPDL